MASSDLDDREEFSHLECGRQTDENGASPGYVDWLVLSDWRYDWSGKQLRFCWLHENDKYRWELQITDRLEGRGILLQKRGRL